jgi:hypothetical protein
VVLQQALADLNAASRNFFVSVAGRLKGPKAGRPRFRSRKDRRQAIRFTAYARFKGLASGKLRLPKIGDVPVRWSRPLPPEPSRVTVIKEPRQGRRAGGDGPRSAGKTGSSPGAAQQETHPKLRRDAAQAGLSALQGGEEVKEVR